MSYQKKPNHLNLDYRGYVEGVTHVSKSDSKPLCHFFGGIPYALPPIGPFRFSKPRPLPACYRYGTRVSPGRFDKGAAVCPQGGFECPSTALVESWDEDCLQCNVWIPAGQAPEGGWPVLFFIHGGWLQIGTPNTNDFTALLSETICKCIIVLPAYRLNVFGFLASQELADEASSANQPYGNCGFWDQRLALEWTYKSISYFGGNAAQITIAGYSAGSHSVFHQLSYDLYLPRNKRIVKQAVMHSNGSGMQPKTLAFAQHQFDALLRALNIPTSLPAAEKLARLRNTSAIELVQAATSISIHEFRAVSDGAFVREELFDDIDSGIYARRLKEAGVKLIIGECQDENFLYSSYRQPKTDTRESLRKRLYADYPYAASDAVLNAYSPNGRLPTWRPCKNWKEDAYGYIFADLQVHALERGFVDRLVKGGAGDNVLRYRIEWRAKCCDGGFPKEWGVTHGTDMAIWYWGNGMNGVGLKKDEKKLVQKFAEPIWKLFVGKFDADEWGTKNHKEARRIKSDGSVDIWQDEDWQRGVHMYNVVRDALKDRGSLPVSKL